MDDHRKAHAYFLYGSDAERRTWYKFFAISLLFHVTLFVAVLFMPDFNSRGRRFSPSAMNVRMVTLPQQQSAPPGAPPATTAEKKAPAPTPKPVKKVTVPSKKEPVVEAQVQAKPKPEISLAPKKKIAPKKSLKKKTYKPEKVTKRAIRKLEKKTESARPKQIESALAKLEEKVKRQGPTQALKRQAASGTLPSAGGGGYGGTSGDLSARALSQLDIYKAEVAYQVQKHWAFSEQLAGISKKLEAVLVIKILPSGEITDIWFEKRSGNRYLDDSAYKAIKKTNPLPRLPDGYLRPFYNLGLIFTPSGLR